MKNKKNLCEILSTVFAMFIIIIVTGLLFNFDVDKVKLFYENASFDVKFWFLIFNFVLPYVFGSYFTKFCFWIKNKFKTKNKVVK